MTAQSRADTWNGFDVHSPQWFRSAPLGIFIHWGPYSVPAWAEPTAEFGSVKKDIEWFTHVPYAEWYGNTMRIEGSPTQAHHAATFGDCGYDKFLDTWKAEQFNADELVGFLASIGADYVIPTTKHHDGVTLWDAPATGDRNTVQRGPKRDLVGEFAKAADKHGLRFGVYYSGGLDWHYRPGPPHTTGENVKGDGRPTDEAYAAYAFDQIGRAHV